LTVSPHKLTGDEVPLVPSDLAGIVAAWPSIPDQIKAAVRAVLAPYLAVDAEKGGDE
jgi:hypothetical protein